MGWKYPVGTAVFNDRSIKFILIFDRICIGIFAINELVMCNNNLKKR